MTATGFPASPPLSTAGPYRRPVTGPRALAVVGGLLALGACSAGPDAPARDACNAVQAWVAEGHPADRLAVVVEAAQDAAGSSTTAPVQDAVAGLGAAAADGPVAAAEAAQGTLATCRTVGWEPAEG